MWSAVLLPARPVRRIPARGSLVLSREPPMGGAIPNPPLFSELDLQSCVRVGRPSPTGVRGLAICSSWTSLARAPVRLIWSPSTSPSHEAVGSQRTRELLGLCCRWLLFVPGRDGFCGCLVAECGVDTLAIVEHLDVFGNHGAGPGVGGERGAVDEFVLQCPEERFGQRVIPAHPGPAH